MSGLLGSEEVLPRGSCGRSRVEGEVLGDEVKGQRAQCVGCIDCRGHLGWWWQLCGEKVVRPLPMSLVCKGSDQEGGGLGLRSGLPLGEWRGNGVDVALGSREAGDPTSCP